MYRDQVNPRDLSVQGYCVFTVEDVDEEYNTLDLGLVLVNVEVDDPEARRFEVEVPGRDGTLDLTEALGGVYFSNREVRLTFACINYTTARHHLLASTLRNLLDGRMVRCMLYDDPAYYWHGRCQVEAERPGAEHTEVLVTVDAEPHKLAVTSSYEAWKWSPFSFVDGVITQVTDVTLVNGQTKSVTLPIDPARGKPTLWLNVGSSGAVSARLSTQASWQVLRSGRNTFPEIRMSDRAEVVLQLKGTGSVGVEYRIGSL